MKRMHIHIAVKDLKENVSFYSALFDASPILLREDYAKWSLDNPAVNFSLSNRGTNVGINHLGLQVDTQEELDDIEDRLNTINALSASQLGVSCCYARSDKHWTVDPQGVPWESFRSLGVLSDTRENDTVAYEAQSACCIPVFDPNSSPVDSRVDNANGEQASPHCC